MTLARTLTASSAFAAAALAAPAWAQHADFVLFGDPNPAGIAEPPEQRHVAPITSPFYHEDSFITTDLRAWYLYHDFPSAGIPGGVGGGRANAVALQVRVALTDRLQLVAYKDGYADFETGAIKDDGPFDLAAGLKYAVIQDWENDLHVAVGVGYELGIGDDEALQEDDEARIWASIDKGFGKLHTGATINVIIPTDAEDPLGDSTSIFWHARADYYLHELFSPVVELNGYHTVEEGDNAPLTFNGVDVANLGGGQSEDVITIGFGGETRPLDNLAFRFAYEFPLLENEDLFGYRWTLSLKLDF
ncbi:MAG: hypothetical protein AAGE65_05790 [Planctomycetota bacterium]